MGFLSFLGSLFGGSDAPKANNQSSVSKRVASGEYIASLRVGRSWVLPQMLAMGSDREGNFSVERYKKAVMALPADNQQLVVMRNMKALKAIQGKDEAGYRARARWWNAQIAALYKTQPSDTPAAFVNAYAGDGAYSAMMTMVKYLGITYEGEDGQMLSREECLADIEAKAEKFEADGMKLVDFCNEKFFARPGFKQTLAEAKKNAQH